jgi:hypothetical protein
MSVLGFLEVVMKYLIGLVLILSALMFACSGPPGCIPEIQPPFHIFGNFSNYTQEIPMEFELSTQSYYRYRMCNDPVKDLIKAQNITFYNGDNAIGSTMLGGKLEGIVIWKATPGKDGIPLTGSGTLRLYAINNDNGDKSEERMIPFTIKP